MRTLIETKLTLKQRLKYLVTYRLAIKTTLIVSCYPRLALHFKALVSLDDPGERPQVEIDW